MGHVHSFRGHACYSTRLVVLLNESFDARPSIDGKLWNGNRNCVSGDLNVVAVVKRRNTEIVGCSGK